MLSSHIICIVGRKSTPDGKCYFHVSFANANHNMHLMTFKAMKPVFICDKFRVCLHLSNWCQPLWLIVSKPIIFCCKKNYWNAFCKYRGKIFQMISWNNINIRICNCCIMQMKPHVLDAQNFYNDVMLWSLIYVRQ